MKQGEKTNLSSEMLGVEGNLQKSFRTGAEQEVIEDLLLVAETWRQEARRGADLAASGSQAKVSRLSH